MTQTELEKSLSYTLRYRVLNSKGWSEWSPYTSFVAADVPSKPPAPILAFVVSTQIDLSLEQISVDNGGQPILSWRLEINEGELLTDFSTV